MVVMQELTTFMGTRVGIIQGNIFNCSKEEELIDLFKKATRKPISELRIICNAQEFHRLSPLFNGSTLKWLVEEKESARSNSTRSWSPKAAKRLPRFRGDLRFEVSSTGERLRLGSTDSTMGQVVKRLSGLPICESSDAVQFSSKKLDRTAVFPLHEEKQCEAGAWNDQVIAVFCHRMTILVDLKSYGWNSGSESPKRQSLRIRPLLAFKPLPPPAFELGARFSRGLGLVIEGKCTNKNCLTEGSTVFLDCGFRHFDLILDRAKHGCRLCRNRVKPKQYSFHDCLWKVVQVKKGSDEPLTGGWHESRNTYETFKWDSKEHAAFLRFQIFVRPRPKLNEDGNSRADGDSSKGDDSSGDDNPFNNGDSCQDSSDDDHSSSCENCTCGDDDFSEDDDSSGDDCCCVHDHPCGDADSSEDEDSSDVRSSDNENRCPGDDSSDDSDSTSDDCSCGDGNPCDDDDSSGDYCTSDYGNLCKSADSFRD